MIGNFKENKIYLSYDIDGTIINPLINYIRQNSRYSRRDAQQKIVSGMCTY